MGNLGRAATLTVLLAGLVGCVGPDAESTSAPEASAEEGEDALVVPRVGESRGVLGGYEHGRVWGWAQLLDDDTPVHVRIEVDDEPVIVLLADQPRRDLFDKGLHPTGHAGFSGVIEETPRGAEVNAVIVETGAVLTNAPCVVQGHGPVSSCTEALPRGALAPYDGGWIHGWAQIVGRDAPVVVRIDIDGEPFERVVADLPRPDLVGKRLHPTGHAGFRLELGSLPAGTLVEAFIDETGDPLMGSPVTIPRDDLRRR